MQFKQLLSSLRKYRTVLGLAIVALSIGCLDGRIALRSSLAQADDTWTDREAAGDDELDIGVSGDDAASESASRHNRVTGAVKVPPGTAEHIYRDLIQTLERAYRKSRYPVVDVYRDWDRVNNAPFHSYSHGRRLLNTYRNATALAYRKFEHAGKLPAGSVIATDSFAVDEGGNVLPGPLFLMEKMPPGFNYVSGDWRFTQINSDSTIAGQTRGTHAAAVAHCVRCHLAAAKTDFLFFPPSGYRTKPDN